MSTDIQEYPTLETSDTLTTLPVQTFSPSLFRALESRLLEKVKDLKIRIADCGLMPKGLLAKVDLDTLQLKTVQISLFEDYQEYLQDLPSSGIMLNGRVYQALSSVSSNAVKGFILLPTPTKADSRASGGKGFYFGKPKAGRGHVLSQYIRDGPLDGTYPNPDISEALMGFPPSYTDLRVLEMPSYH